MYNWKSLGPGGKSRKFPQVITIFSAPKYTDNYNNKGAIIKFEVEFCALKNGWIKMILIRDEGLNVCIKGKLVYYKDSDLLIFTLNNLFISGD